MPREGLRLDRAIPFWNGVGSRSTPSPLAPKILVFIRMVGSCGQSLEPVDCTVKIALRKGLGGIFRVWKPALAGKWAKNWQRR